MEELKQKPLSVLVFIPLLLLILIRPFFSGLAYPTIELYYENIIIFMAIMTLLTCRAGLNLPYKLAITLLAASYALSTFFSINMQNSIAETVKFISFFSIFFMVSQLDERQKKLLIDKLVLVAVIISIYAIYQYFWGYQHTIDYLKKTNSDFLLTSSYARDILLARRSIATFPSPNILGSYLVICFFLSLQLFPSPFPSPIWGEGRVRGLLKLLPSLLIAIALILTKSMGAWLSLMAALAILFALSHRSIKNKKIIIVSLVLIAIALTFILITRWDRLTNLENPQNSITQRLHYWRTALAIIKDHALLGVGPGNFHELFLEYSTIPTTGTRYAHNILLHTWAETGILGLMAIIYLIFNFLRKFKIQSEYKLILLAGFAFILHNLIDNAYFIPEVSLLWWVLLALSF